MPKMITILLLVCSTTSGRSQNIYSALHLNEEREYKTKRPKTINQTNIFYSVSGKKTDKSTKTFDDAGMILTEDRFNEEGEPISRIVYENDTTKRIIVSQTFTSTTGYGLKYQQSFFTYDSNSFLIHITKKDGKGNIFEQIELVNDKKGHPVKLSGYHGDGSFYGEEVASYLYETNKAVTSVLKDGSVLSTDTIEINFNNSHLYPSEGSVYNDKGDAIRYASKNLDGTKTQFEVEYFYDSFGNCTEERIYKVYTTQRGKPKKDLDRVFRKTYTY